MQSKLKIAGLNTSNNELSSVSEGSLALARNIDILSADIAQPRRGFELAAATGYADTAHRTDKLFFYQDKMFSHHGTLGAASLLKYYNSGWQSVGSYDAPSGRRMQTVSANQNLYFTTDEGVKKLDVYSGTVANAGIPKALNMEVALTATGTWFEGEIADQIVAYRNLWAKYDANDNLIVGAPSGRTYATNNLGAGNDKSVGVLIYIPSGISTANFCQLYRSLVVASPTATPVEPSDELYLTYEVTPTAGSFTSYSKTFLDAAVNTGTEVITITAHGFATGDVVTVSNSGGALPTGLAASTQYYVISATTDTLKLSASYGGAAVNITAAAGGGTHTIAGAGVIYIDDITPEELLGAALYTNATQEGLVYQNEQPPLARDIATFKDCTFYAYTTSKHRYYLTLLSASSMANDDTVTIGGVTYTAKAAESAVAAQFKRFTAGSASQNIDDTAKSLVNVINRYSSSTVYAFYLSSGSDLPGKILLEERSIGGTAFAITASVATYWSPAGIPSSGSTETSTNDNFKNGLAWSKPKQPEHVSLVSYEQVGSEDDEILRIVPLKDALIIFKQDGIFRLTGSYPSFDIELLDSSAKLIGAETPSILNNEIYCLTDLGICRVSDSVEIISLKINQEIIQNISTNATLIASIGFGQGYETEKKYYLFLPSSSGDTYPTFAYVYNIFTNSFVKHYLNATCATVYAKTLYFGNGATEYVMKERKNYSYLDYADYNFTANITVISSLSITIDAGADNVAVGDILWQSNSLFATVTAINSITSVLTIDQDPGFTVAACTLLKAIDTKLKWTVFVDPSPGMTKQYHSAQFFFQEAFNGNAYIGFSTDLAPSEEQVLLAGNDNGSWGLFPWGTEPWGGVNTPRNWSQWTPRGKQRCSQMNVSFAHRWGYSTWKMTGAMLNGDPGSEKIRRV